METINSYSKLSEIETNLKSGYPKLTEFERLSLAIQIQRNEILSAAFVLNSSSPNGLEALAIVLGYSTGFGSGNINDRLSEIASAVEDLKPVDK